MGPDAGRTWADARAIAAIWLVPDGDVYRIVRSAAASALPLEIQPDFKIEDQP